MCKKIGLLMALVFMVNVFCGFVVMGAEVVTHTFMAQDLAEQEGNEAMKYKSDNVPTNGSWLGLSGYIFRASEVNDYIAYRVNVPKVGNYNISIKVISSSNRGTYQMSIGDGEDSENIGMPISYVTDNNAIWDEDFGNIYFKSAGFTEFKFTCTDLGKDTGYGRGFLALIAIYLTEGEVIKPEPAPVGVGKTYHVEEPSQVTYTIQGGNAEPYTKIIDSTEYKGIDYTPSAVNDSIIFNLKPDRPGIHRVSARVIGSENAGKYQLYIAENAVGGAIDFHSEADTVMDIIIGEGSITDTVNTIPFEFKCIDKGSGSGALSLGHITIATLGDAPMDGIIYQAEDLYSEASKGNGKIVNKNTNWTVNNAYYFGTLYQASAANDSVLFKLNVDKEGVYKVFTRAIKSGNRGVYQLYIDGKKIGSPHDFRVSDKTIYEDVKYGRMFLSAGEHTLEFVCTTRGEGYLALDYIALVEHIDAVSADVELYDSNNAEIISGGVIGTDSAISVKGSLSRVDDSLSGCTVVAVLFQENGELYSIKKDVVEFEDDELIEPATVGKTIDITLNTPTDTGVSKIMVFIWNDYDKMEPIIGGITLWEPTEEPGGQS